MSKHSELAEKIMQALYDADILETQFMAETIALIDEKLSGVDPVAFACRTCNKIDWASDKEQKAQPEHISHRGVDIGSCEGKMIKLYESLKVD